MTQWNADGRQQPYYPQQSYGPYQAPPPSPRRTARILALIGSLVVLAVVAVGIVVVIAIRRQADDQKTGQAAAPSAGASTAAAQAGPIDMCLVGNWRQAEYKATFDFTSVTADGKALGKVTVTGSGVEQEITAEGDSVSDYSGVTYTGQTSDGRSVVLSFSGQYRQTLRTSNHQILFSAKPGTMTMTVMVDNKQVLKTSPTGTSNPQPYTCGDNRWTTTSLLDSDSAASFVRTS